MENPIRPGYLPRRTVTFSILCSPFPRRSRLGPMVQFGAAYAGIDPKQPFQKLRQENKNHKNAPYRTPPARRKQKESKTKGRAKWSVRWGRVRPHRAAGRQNVPYSTTQEKETKAGRCCTR